MDFEVLKIRPIILGTAAISVFVLFFVRLVSMAANYEYSFASGLEGAGIYVIHSACSGHKIYHGFANSPNAALFNFLFFESYGLLSRLAVRCGIGILWFDRVLTLLTLFTSATVVALRYRGQLTRLETVFVFSLWFAPFVGWWAFAIRPDMGAVMFFTLSLLTFRWALQDGQVSRFALAGVFCFLAWSFKQTFVVLLPIGVIFAFCRSWRGGLSYTSVFSFLIIATFAVYGLDAYVLNTITISAQHDLSIALVTSSFLNLLAKAGPVIFLAVWILISKIRSGELDRIDVFDSTALVWAVTVFFVCAGKEGAGEYYYLPVYVILILVIAKGLPVMRRGRESAVAPVAAIGMIASCLVVLLGLSGRATLDVDRAAVMQTENILENAPRPKLVVDDFFALPWMSNYPEQFLFDTFIYNVNIEHMKGAISIEKQVAEGRFASIAARNSFAAGLDLRRYRRIMTINGFSIWLRRDAR